MRKKYGSAQPMPFSRPRDPVITDPAAHAGEQFHKEFIIRKTEDPWKRWETRCTTEQFAKAGNGFVRHCGPTAMTNVILTMNKRYHILRNPAEQMASHGQGEQAASRSPAERMASRSPAEQASSGGTRSWYFPSERAVFLETARIGMESGIYRNTDFLGRFGGTYDIAAGVYIRKCLKAFGIPAQVRGRFLQEPEEFAGALKQGNLLYLQLYRHPTYGNHHLVCYGYVEAENVELGRRYRKMYLIAADGWSRRTRYLDTDSLSLSHSYCIRYAPEKNTERQGQIRILL